MTSYVVVVCVCHKNILNLMLIANLNGYKACGQPKTVLHCLFPFDFCLVFIHQTPNTTNTNYNVSYDNTVKYGKLYK